MKLVYSCIAIAAWFGPLIGNAELNKADYGYSEVARDESIHLQASQIDQNLLSKSRLQPSSRLADGSQFMKKCAFGHCVGQFAITSRNEVGVVLDLYEGGKILVGFRQGRRGVFDAGDASSETLFKDGIRKGSDVVFDSRQLATVLLVVQNGKALVRIHPRHKVTSPYRIVRTNGLLGEISCYGSRLCVGIEALLDDSVKVTVEKVFRSGYALVRMRGGDSRVVSRARLKLSTL